MSRRPAARLLAGAGFAGAVVLALIATPARSWEYAHHAAWPGPAVAFAWALLTTTARGVRLSLLVGRRTTVDRAVAAATVAQLAVATLPWRLGELALVPALRAAGLPGSLRAISVLVVTRVLDLATLLVWGIAAAVLLGARSAWRRSPCLASPAPSGSPGAPAARCWPAAPAVGGERRGFAALCFARRSRPVASCARPAVHRAGSAAS